MYFIGILCDGSTQSSTSLWSGRKMMNGFQFFFTNKCEKCGMHTYSAPLSQYFVEPPFAAITAASLFGDVSTSFAHLESAIFAHSSLQSSSSSVRLDGEFLWTAIFKSCHIFSIGFGSGLWPSHSNTWIRFDQNHSIVALAACLGSFRWKVNLPLAMHRTQSVAEAVQ